MSRIIESVYKIDNGTDYDTVYFKTKAKLVEMNDGSIIQDVISNHSESLAKKVDITSPQNDLSMNRIYREVLDSGISISQTPNNTTKYWAEGMCVTGTDKIIYALFNGQRYTNDVLLKEIQISTGAVLRTAVLPLGHANSLCYNPTTNKLYSAYVSSNLNGSSTNISKISVINYDTLTLNVTKDFSTSPVYVTSVSYDKKTGKMYVSNGHSLYEWNLTNDSFTIVCTYSEENTGASVQSEKVQNDLIYSVRQNPSYVAVYDMQGKLLRTMNIPLYFGNYYVGEIEDISFDFADDGTFYIMSMVEAEYGITVFPQIFKGNVYKGDFIRNNQSSNIMVRNNIYVDINATGVNPDGSSGNPFKELCEAIVYLNCPNVNARTIIIASGNYAFTYIGRMSIELDFGIDAMVYGIACRDSNVYMINPTFLMNNAISRALNTFRNCVVKLQQPTFINISNTSIIYNEQSLLGINGVSTYTTCAYTYVVDNNSQYPVQCSKLDSTIIVKDSVNASSGTPKHFNTTLSATNSTFSFDNGVSYDLTNKIYKSITFLCSYGNIKFSSRLMINDSVLNGTHQFFNTWYGSSIINTAHIDIVFVKDASSNVTGVKINANTVGAFNTVGSTWSYATDSASLSIYGIILE